jgi:phosphomannomutase
MLIANEIIKKSGISFGTSGARGLVIDFTHDVCAAFVHSFLSVISNNFNFERVALAIDNRPSSYGIAQACAFAIEQHGFRVEYHGVIPTPALAHYSMQNKIPCIMVTGSHIPFDRNGLKFYRPDGEISKNDELDIVNSNYTFAGVKSIYDLEVDDSGADFYISRYVSLYNSNILKNKRLGVFEHSSAGRDLYATLFRKLGAEVISLGRSNEFVPIDTEAVGEEHRHLAKKWAQQFQLDAIFSTDGDGDRPLISDEHGEWLRGDILGLLTARELGIDALAVPVSCNSAIENSNEFKVVKRTKIGSPYVIGAFEELMQDYNSVAGFEANGGFLLASDITINGECLSSLPTRDAVLPALMLLVASQNSSVSALTKQLPQRFTWSDRLKDFSSEKSNRIIQNAIRSPDGFLEIIGVKNLSVLSVDQLDGVRFTLSNGDVLHLRPSGNAPELRCYTEAMNEEIAKKYVTDVLNRINLLA